MPTHTLNKLERLKGHTKIRSVFNAGEKFKVFPLTVFYLFEDRTELAQISSPLKMGDVTGIKWKRDARSAACRQTHYVQSGGARHVATEESHVKVSVLRQVTLPETKNHFLT